MAAPFVSAKRLVDNSLSAMLSALEMYNKPQIKYRDEITVILVVNAWELALKAALRQAKKSVFYPKERNKPYRSVTLDSAINKVSQYSLWPKDIDGNAVSVSIKVLSEYRNRATHLYNAPDLGVVIYQFLQQNILNYRDFMLQRFDKDFADSVTWQLLPLGATAPPDMVEYMRVDQNQRMQPEVSRFIEDTRYLMESVESIGGDVTRILTVYNIHMRSVKTMTSADLAVAVDPQSQAPVITRLSDPSKTHPYTRDAMLARVNQKRKGKKQLNSYDHSALCWKFDLRDNPQYAWRHGNEKTTYWSNDAISLMAKKSDEVCASVRAEYSSHRRVSRK